MSLPKLTATIAEQVSKGQGNEFFSIISDIKAIKEKDEPYIIFMTLDLSKDQIYFELDKRFNKDSIHEYFYFGNNPAAATQYYLVREGTHLKYLITSVFSNLYRMFKNNNMGDCEFSRILLELEKQKMIILADKVGAGEVNFKKFSITESGEYEDVEYDAKDGIKIGGKKTNPEAFIRLFIKGTNKYDKFVLIVPKVVLSNKEKVILSKHEDYLKLVKTENKLGETNDENGEGKRVCHICKKIKNDVSSDYTKKLSRTGINKIFTTKTKNYSSFGKKFNYDENYAICNACYQKLRDGEKIISEQFKSKIAGEDVFIIPQALLSTDLDYVYLNYLKDAADLAFKSKDAAIWLGEIKESTHDIDGYMVNFIIYRTDGNSVSILETIEDVPMLSIERILKTFEENYFSIGSKDFYMSLGYIYRIIPVRVNKNGIQLNIGRVLSFYKAILSGEKINKKILFEYACEALDKGLKQLSKTRVDNYYNLNVTRYIGYGDYYIRDLIYTYLILMKTCQDLKLLNQGIFKFSEREGINLESNDTLKGKTENFISSAEAFLNQQGFSNEERALFYLGALTNRVALIQYLKEHKSKPILKKIQFQGMNSNEIYRFYNDIIEKLRQYNKMTYFSENLMKKFHEYYGLTRAGKELSDQERVFFLLSGYSFMVGNRPPDSTEAEAAAQEEFQLEKDNQE